MNGLTNYLSGQAAEDCVARDYGRRGHEVIGRRWRGQGGEIDLVVRNGEGLIFVEVKKAGDFARAAESLCRRQMDRIYAAASEFLGSQPRGQLTDVRFDVALVNGRGELDVIENAFAA